MTLAAAQRNASLWEIPQTCSAANNKTFASDILRKKATQRRWKVVTIDYGSTSQLFSRMPRVGETSATPERLLNVHQVLLQDAFKAKTAIFLFFKNLWNPSRSEGARVVEREQLRHTKVIAPSEKLRNTFHLHKQTRGKTKSTLGSKVPPLSLLAGYKNLRRGERKIYGVVIRGYVSGILLHREGHWWTAANDHSLQHRSTARVGTRCWQLYLHWEASCQQAPNILLCTRKLPPFLTFQNALKQISLHSNEEKCPNGFVNAGGTTPCVRFCFCE